MHIANKYCKAIGPCNASRKEHARAVRACCGILRWFMLHACCPTFRSGMIHSPFLVTRSSSFVVSSLESQKGLKLTAAVVTSIIAVIYRFAGTAQLGERQGCRTQGTANTNK